MVYKSRQLRYRKIIIMLFSQYFMEDMNKHEKYVFVGKTLFFPKERILVIGDLHLGYENAMRKKGLDLPIGQFREMQEELEKTIKNIKARYGKIWKIIFLGDIKHNFGFIGEEKEEINKLIRFVRKYVDNENSIIFIRGNHEKHEKSGKYVDYYIVKDAIFLHGDRDFLEMYDKKINLIVMGHLHPTLTLSDKMRIKREKYKCFLVGRYKKKDFVVVPSFLSVSEGVSLNEFEDEGYDFGVIPQAELKNFKVFVCQEVGVDALDFGKFMEI